MLLIERDQQALDPRAIAGSIGHPFRKSPDIFLTAARTLFEDNAMFSHNQLPGRQLKDLSPLLGQAACHLSERLPTGGALLRRVGEDLVRLRDLFQRRARMTRLPTRLFGRRLPQRTRLLGRAVTRRRLATIAAIGG